jgi:hypothetical protein
MKIETTDISTLNNKPLEEWRPSDKHIPADPDRWIEEVNRCTPAENKKALDVLARYFPAHISAYWNPVTK